MECPKVEVLPQHEWLQRMIGEWTCEGEATMGPDQPPVTWSGAETVRAVGPVWVIGETPDGGPMKNIVTLGYDPAQQKFVGTFITSVMTKLWVYEGDLDGNVLTLRARGPAMMPGQAETNYRDIVELVSDDERTLTSMMEMNGAWVRVMFAKYKRVPSPAGR